jgi:hypothetical protein
METAQCLCKRALGWHSSPFIKIALAEQNQSQAAPSFFADGLSSMNCRTLQR